MKKRKRKSWRNIEWAKGYRVSSDGEIKYKNKILHQRNSLGYRTVIINHVSYRVHRLVAEAFVKNPKPKQYNMVNHKNERMINEYEFQKTRRTSIWNFNNEWFLWWIQDIVQNKVLDLISKICYN